MGHEGHYLQNRCCKSLVKPWIEPDHMRKMAQVGMSSFYACHPEEGESPPRDLMSPESFPEVNKNTLAAGTKSLNSALRVFPSRS